MESSRNEARTYSHPSPAQNNCPACARLKKALIGECMISLVRAIRGRDLERRYGQIRCSDCCIGCGSTFVAGACNSGEWSNRRWGSRRTHRRGAARRRPGASCSSTAGLLCSRAGLRRRTSLPIGSRALLGWVWLAKSASRDLQLIAHFLRLTASSRFEVSPAASLRPPLSDKSTRKSILSLPDLVLPQAPRPPRVRKHSLQAMPSLIARLRTSHTGLRFCAVEAQDNHLLLHGRVLSRACCPPLGWASDVCRSRKSPGRRWC